VAGALAVGRLGHVVDRDRRHNRVEPRVVERQRPHVGVDDLDALAHALGLGVGERRGAAVVRLVGRRPDVDADGAAVAQPLRRPDEQQPAPAADVEDVLAAAQPERVEQAVALDQLAAAARVDHRRDRREEHDACEPEGPGEPAHAGERERDRRGEERDAGDREAAHHARCVEPVVDLHDGPAR
jgi:hypothetical protein